MTDRRVSLVVPVSDRWEFSRAAMDDLVAARDALGTDANILFVFDGHRRREAAECRTRFADRPEVRILELPQRLGEAAVLAAAIRQTKGAAIVRVPSWPQVSLAAIPAMIKALDGGADAAFAVRTDASGRVTGGLPRRILNSVLSRAARMEIRDIGGQLAALTREAADALPLSGDLNRYLPVLVAHEGLATFHVPVPETPAAHGERRTLRSYAARALDLMTVLFLARSTSSPLRSFGVLGLPTMLAGALITAWLVWERFHNHEPMAGRPLLLLGLLLFTAGLQILAIGFLGELMVYLHYRDRHPDRVRSLLREDDPS